MVVASTLGRVGASLLSSAAVAVAITLVFGVAAPIVFVLVTGGAGSGMGEMAGFLLMLTVPVAAVTSLVLGLILIPYFYAKFTPPVE